jgi:(p)ppGpp synthase/HD superfamily hydrolase
MSPDRSQDAYIAAYRFAARAHRWQLVPGTATPYVMHLTFVSMEIMSALAATEGSSALDGNLAVQCALLHDVLEDTRVRYDQLRELFGEAVASGVLALTKDKKLPRPEQMPDCLRRIRQQPVEIWMVKLADRITNLQPPPPHWSKQKILEYHKEASVIHAMLKDASPFLAERLETKIGQYAAFVS